MKRFLIPIIVGLVLFGAVSALSAQAVNVPNTVNVATDTSLADPTKPTIKSIKGGYYLEWPRMTRIGDIQLTGPLAGKFEVQFDVPEDAIGKPRSVSDDPNVLMTLGNYWIQRGKPERAIPIYQRGAETSKENFLFQNNLAMLYSTVQGDHDAALKLIDEALTNAMDNVTLLDSKGLILMNAGKPEEAIPHLERAVELSCQGPIYVLHLAQAMDMAGREGGARDWFEKARPLLETSPNKLKKENKDMFDNLRLKYGTAAAE